jgi:hypothetical protein
VVSSNFAGQDQGFDFKVSTSAHEGDGVTWNGARLQGKSTIKVMHDCKDIRCSRNIKRS